MASEIQGLPDLRAYLKSGNLVVPLSFPYIDLPKRHEALIERKLPAQQPKEAGAQTVTASGTAMSAFWRVACHRRSATASAASDTTTDAGSE